MTFEAFVSFVILNAERGVQNGEQEAPHAKGAQAVSSYSSFPLW